VRVPPNPQAILLLKSSRVYGIASARRHLTRRFVADLSRVNWWLECERAFTCPAADQAMHRSKELAAHC